MEMMASGGLATGSREKGPTGGIDKSLPTSAARKRLLRGGLIVTCHLVVLLRPRDSALEGTREDLDGAPAGTLAGALADPLVGTAVSRCLVLATNVVPGLVA